MSRDVHAERVEAAAPTDGARRGAEIALAGRGQTRETLLLVGGSNDKRPGLTVAPWTIDGTLDAASELGLRVRCNRLGHMAPLDPAGRRLVRRGVNTQRDGQNIALRVPGTRRPMLVPRSWIGTHACLIAPWFRGPGDDMGPMATTLATLARTCTTESLLAPHRVGAWLASHLFASAWIIVDATWKATLSDNGPRLDATSRLFVAPAADGLIADALIAIQAPRPQAPIGLAGRQRIGLRKRSRAVVTPGELRVPGPLARTWRAYPDHRAESGR